MVGKVYAVMKVPIEIFNFFRSTPTDSNLEMYLGLYPRNSIIS